MSLEGGADRRGRGAQVLAFGAFQLLPHERVLRRAGQRLRFQGPALEILIALVERRGRLVSKDELMARVWPGMQTREHLLRVHISMLRKTLREANDGIRYVENVTGHGYRFVAPVAELGDRQPRQLVGHERVLATLTAQLTERRLVTMTGPAGVGKSVMAAAAAEFLVRDGQQTLCYVDLDALVDPLTVAGHIASALELAPGAAEPLGDLEPLQRRRILLVLDGCERVVEPVAHAAEKLLTAVPGLRVLATSREALRVQGEQVLRLAPLKVAAPIAALSSAEALRSPAVSLFALHARQVAPDFEVDDTNARAVAAICRQLDGLPLAIELAAGLTRTCAVSLLAVADECPKRLARGQGARSAQLPTLPARLDRSYTMLSPQERLVLDQLAKLAGWFDVRRSWAAVCGAASLPMAGMLDILLTLASRSLLVTGVTGDKVFFRLLHTTRAYLRERRPDPE